MIRVLGLLLLLSVHGLEGCGGGNAVTHLSSATCTTSAGGGMTFVPPPSCKGVFVHS
jgi:hypothetical protein